MKMGEKMSTKKNKRLRELLDEKGELLVYRIRDDWLIHALDYDYLPSDYCNFKTLSEDCLRNVEILEKKISYYREIVKRLEVLHKNHGEAKNEQNRRNTKRT